MANWGASRNLLGVWSAFFAPAGVPAEVSKALISAIEKAVKGPATVGRLANLEMVADHEPPEKLMTEIRDEHRQVEQMTKKSRIGKVISVEPIAPKLVQRSPSP